MYFTMALKCSLVHQEMTAVEVLEISIESSPLLDFELSASKQYWQLTAMLTICNLIKLIENKCGRKDIEELKRAL